MATKALEAHLRDLSIQDGNSGPDTLHKSKVSSIHGAPALYYVAGAAAY